MTLTYFRSIDRLRSEDRGHLLEHLVLNELLARFSRQQVFFWRDKQQHEVDFVVRPGRGQNLLAIACKVNPHRFDIPIVSTRLRCSLFGGDTHRG